MAELEIGSQKWRLNNLYHIIDEQGQPVLFKMRPAQEQFFDDMWYYNIVLKARQLGFTTLIDLIGLDMVLFKKNFTAVIIAEDTKKAADIFERKITYPYRHLPQEIQDWCPVVASSAEGSMSFGNGSSIQVMVSARSGTCQFLHISEFGPVCAMHPAKATEIVTGSLPAVHAGSFCFIESTAMGNSGYFYDMTMAANAKRLAGRKLGQQEYRLHFYPWWQNKEYQIENSDAVIPDRLLRYFDDLYTRHGIELTDEQQAWYANQEQTQHEKMWQEYPSYAEEAFKVAQEGAYYARAFAQVYQENRICRVPYEPDLPVYTAWDLGMSDETSIWFFQFFGKEVRVIDYYENNGEGLPHYARVLREKGYRYERHFAPHDIAVRELGSGVSRMETARKLGINFERIRTNLDVMGGIEACREILGYCWFDEGKTETGRKALENYKKEWDEKHNCYRTSPLHDWCSHGADAFRTGAMAWKMGLCGERMKSTAIRVKGGLQRI